MSSGSGGVEIRRDDERPGRQPERPGGDIVVRIGAAEEWKWMERLRPVEEEYQAVTFNYRIRSLARERSNLATRRHADAPAVHAVPPMMIGALHSLADHATVTEISAEVAAARVENCQPFV